MGDDGNYLQSPFRNCKPRGAKSRAAEENAAEIQRVDAAIDELSGPNPSHFLDGAGDRWVHLGSVSIPVAIRSLKHYRQRLARR